MKSNLNKSFVFGAIFAMAAGLAAAQSTYNLSNVGAVHNTTNASATVTGANSTSFSRATGEQSVKAVGSASVQTGSLGGYTGAMIGMGGDVKTTSAGSAFNISTGPGAVGQAGSKGWADGGVTANAGFNAPGQSIQMGGQVDGGSYQNNPNGSDVNVQATTNQQGYAAASSHGGFEASGHVGSGPVAGGSQVTLEIKDTKFSEATAETGSITFTGTQPTGLSPAGVTFAHGASAVVFNGSAADPVGN